MAGSRLLGETQEVCDATSGTPSNATRGATTGEEIMRINHDPLVRIETVEFLDAAGAPCAAFPVGSCFRARIHYDCRRKVTKPIFSLSLVTVGEHHRRGQSFEF